MSAPGPSRHFAAERRLGRFLTEADIKWQASSAGSVANDPKQTSERVPATARAAGSLRQTITILWVMEVPSDRRSGLWYVLARKTPIAESDARLHRCLVFLDLEREGEASANLVDCVSVDQRMAKRSIKAEFVVHLPDSPSQS